MSIGILGGGLAGLTVGALTEGETEILEAADECGGLCRSWTVDGFTHDFGGHILFSRDAELLAELLAFGSPAVAKEAVVGANSFATSFANGVANEFAPTTAFATYARRRRKNTVRFKGRFMKYPFENELSALDKEDLFFCLYEYLVAVGATGRSPLPDAAPSNLEDWVLRTFGRGIAELYLLPYNRKIWKREPREMSAVWSERIPRPPLEDIVKSALGLETEGYVHQLYFYYPTTGGIQTLTRALEPRARAITRNFRVARVEPDGDGWTVVSAAGDERRYDRLVSTIPLPELIRCLADCPPDLREEAARLEYNAERVVLLGVNHDRLPQMTATYVPDESVWAHRICFNNQFSPHNSPAGCSSLMAEITVRPGSELEQKTDAELVDHVLTWCAQEGWLKAADVIATNVARMQYAYVVSDLGYPQRLARLTEYCEGRGLLLTGRVGAWQYWNMDQVYANARATAEKLRQG